MAVPDFLRARRQLRRGRLQDALGLPRTKVDVNKNRDHLLERLAAAADAPVADFDSLEPSVVDTVVSLALAEVDESPNDTLVVVLLCCRILAADGQFARLHVLAERLASISKRLVIERPFLAAATEALSLSLQMQDPQAISLLDKVLGFEATDQPVPRKPRTKEHLTDLLMASTVRTTLKERGRHFAVEVQHTALDIQDGLLLAFAELMQSWIDAVEDARPDAVLTEADPIFSEPALVTYLRDLPVKVLYPSQIKAVRSGSTLDADRVVSLPTSSGKTLLAELRIAACLTRSPNARAIYVAPYRLVARQVERSLKRGLRSLAKRVQDLGSGYDPFLDAADPDTLPDVAICTPERLDSLLRIAATPDANGLVAAQLLDTTKLLVFDELQLIGRPGRGQRFEMVLTRLRDRYPEIQILGLAAAAHGAETVARWLTGSPAIAGATRPTGTLEIVWDTDGNLRQRVEPRPTRVAELPRTSTAIEDAARLIVDLIPRHGPVLAVEPTRRYAESLARRVFERSLATAAEWRDSLPPQHLRELDKAVEEIRFLLGEEHPLGRYLENGVAFHHASVPTQALQHIERLAAQRALRAVCATTTVAEGADLPFRAVVIPHLTFGDSGKLERDLYLNIIGRAGRANVSMEGMVFILNSDAPNLRTVVERSLWTESRSDIRGRIAEISTMPSNLDQWTDYNELQSQVLGWLGDGRSYVPNQAQHLARKTLSWHQAGAAGRAKVEAAVSHALTDLETRRLVRAGSPYRLTRRGKLARLSGLSPLSVERIERALDADAGRFLGSLQGQTFLTHDSASQLASMLLETIEVLKESLWLRHAGGTDVARFQALQRVTIGREDRKLRPDSNYQADLELITAWISGATLVDIGRLAPTYSNANAVFGSNDETRRTSDAADYIGSIAYPSMWAWSGIRVLAGEAAEQLPGFIRHSIELGLPSEGTTKLASFCSVTRHAAMSVAQVAGHSWPQIEEWVLRARSFDELELTTLDEERLAEFKARRRTRDDHS